MQHAPCAATRLSRSGWVAWTPQFGLGIAKKVLEWVFALIDKRNAREIQALYSLVLSRLSDCVQACCKECNASRRCR